MLPTTTHTHLVISILRRLLMGPRRWRMPLSARTNAQCVTGSTGYMLVAFQLAVITHRWLWIAGSREIRAGQRFLPSKQSRLSNIWGISRLVCFLCSQLFVKWNRLSDLFKVVWKALIVSRSAFKISLITFVTCLQTLSFCHRYRQVCHINKLHTIQNENVNLPYMAYFIVI